MEELTKLYDLLVREGYYTNSFKDFESKYQDSSYRDKVFSVVSRDNFYTKSKEEFLEKYKPVKKKVTSEPVGDTEGTTASTTEQAPASPTSSDSQQSEPISERGVGFESQYSAPEPEGVPIPLRPEEPSFRLATIDEIGGEYDDREILSSYQEELDRKKRTSDFLQKQEDFEYPTLDNAEIQANGDIASQTLGESIPEKKLATASFQKILKERPYISPEELSKMAREEGERVERMKQDPYANTILQDDKLWEEENNFKKSLEIIDKKYIQKQEEIVVPELIYNFARYGFSFEETGVGDAMVVTAKNRKKLYVNLDPTFGLGSEESAADLIKFIEDNKAEAYDDTESKFYRDSKVKIQDKKEIKAAVTVLNDQFEKLNNSAIAITESLSKWQDGYNADFSGVKDYDQIKNDPILLEKFLEYNRARKEINAEINALGDKERELELKGSQLDSLVGDYSTMQSKQGNMLGTLFNSFIKGAVSSKGAQAYAKLIDVGTYVLPEAGAPDEDYKASLIESAKDLGLVDKDENLDDLSTDELIEKLGGDTNDFNFAADLLEIFALSIKNPELSTAAYTAFKGSGTAFDQAHSKVLDKYRKLLKYGEPRMYNPYSDVANTTDLDMGMLDAARSDFVLGIGGYNTKISSDATEQFKRIKSESFFNEAFIGVAESLGTMVGTSYQRVPQMYMMVADHLDEEMSANPEFDDISEAEKYFIEAPVGIASAVLEEFGLRNVLAQKGLLNSVILKALGKSTAGTTAKSFQKLIRDDINDAITSGLLVITAGGLAEFETGVAQQASELAIKDIYNEVKGRKMFETPDTWTDYSLQLLKAGGQEMVGGVVLGSIPAAVTSINKSAQNAKTADQKIKADIAFRIFDETLKDPEYRTMYVTKLKQKVASGEMTNAEAKEELAEYEKVLGIAPMVKSTLDSDQRKKAFELIYERQTIESNIGPLDPNLVVDEKNRIKEINEELQNLKPKEDAPAVEEVVSEEVPVDGNGKSTFTIYPESYSRLSDGDKKIVDEGGVLENSMYGFEVGSKENLPDELKDLQPSGTLKVRGKGKKINRFSFTGKQLIESGYIATMQAKEAAPVTEETAPVVEETVAEETAPVVEETVAEEVVAEDAPVAQETTTEEITIFRGVEPKKDVKGKPKTVHKIKKGKFGSDKIEGTDGNKGTKPIKKFTIPAGTTIETVKLPGNTPAATSRVELETEAIDNSTAQVVKLETIDAGGRETQYIIKDDSLLESGVDMTPEEEASARSKPRQKRKSKTKTQKSIDAFVDKKMSSRKTINLSEKNALNKQISDFARGMKEAYKDQKTFKKKAEKLISENFKLFGNLSPSKVKALTRRALNVDFSKPISLDKFIKYAAGLEQITEDNLYKETVSNVKKKTAPKKLIKRVGGILKGKIANYEGKVLSNIHNAIRENNVSFIENRIKALKDKEEKTGELNERETALLESSFISIELLSGNLKTAQNAENKVDALIDGGKSKYREDIKKRSEEYARLVTESFSAITGGKELTDQFGKLEQEAKRKPLTNAIREKISGFLDFGEALRTLLDKIDRTAARDESGYGGLLDKELYEPIADGRRKKDRLDTLKINELSSKLDELYGKKKKKELRDNKIPKNLGTFTDRKGKEVNLFFSQNQAYPLYQYMQDPSNTATFEEMGFTNEMLEAIEEFLTPEVKRWADWQMAEFFPKYYDEINVVYKEMNDIDLPKQKIYVPIIRKVEGSNEKEVGIDQIMFGNPQSTYKSLNQRQDSKDAFDMTKDGNEKLMEYVEGMNTYISFAKPVKKMNVVFKNNKIRRAVKEFNSKETLQAIDGFIERIANNSSDLGKRIALLDKIRGNVTLASLALAPTITIKQLTSIPAYASDIPTKKFISGMGAFARNPKKAADILMKSEYMQKRYKDGFERDMLDGMKRDYDSILKGTSNLKNKMMFLIKWGDAGAILMGGYSVYKYHFDKSIKAKIPIEKSKKIALSKFEEATKLSQQSTNPEDLSHFQSMGSLGKLFTMYMTSPMSYFRQERKSARDFVKGFKAKDKKLMKNSVKRFLTYHFVLPIVFQYVANGLPGLLTDWDDEDEKDLKRAASIGSLNGVFIAGQLISYIGDILTDKAWVSGGKFSPSPAFDAIANIINQAGDVVDEWSKDEEGFSDDLIKEIIDLGLSLDVTVGLPVNRVKKLIENWMTIADDNDLETREKIALGIGYSPYVVTQKSKSNDVKFAKPSKTSINDLKEFAPDLYDAFKEIEDELEDLEVDID